MATFAEKWYNRSGDIVLKQDITEVEIVRSYSLTGNEVVSWDASADGDRSVMAYITGTKLTIVCDSFTDIPKGMFSGFISLEKVTGLRSATTVGKHAFAPGRMIRSAARSTAGSDVTVTSTPMAAKELDSEKRFPTP